MNRKLMVVCIVLCVLALSLSLSGEMRNAEKQRAQIVKKVQDKIANLEQRNKEVPEALVTVLGKLDRRSEKEYDSNKRRSLHKPSTWYFREELQEYWDSGVWNWDYLIKHEYDNATTLESDQWEYYRDSGAWYDDYWSEYSYDGSGNHTETISYYYDATLGKSKLSESSHAGWVEESRSTSTFNGSGQPLVITFYDWDGGAWVGIMRFTSTYDGGGNMLTMIWEFWDDTASDFVMAFKDIHTYAGGFLTQITYQSYFTGVWVTDYRDLFTYDGNGNNTTVFSQYSLDGGASWVNDWFETYTYDGSGNVLTDIGQFWDDTAVPPAWVNSERYTYEYDGSGNMTRNLYEYWNPTLGKSSSAGWEYWDQYLIYWHLSIGEISNEIYQYWNGSSWVNSYHYTYYYSQSTGVEEDQAVVPEKYKLSNYPNPFNPTTEIQFDLPKDGDVSIHVYDLTGRMIKLLAREKNYTAGSHEIIWDGTNDQNRQVASGIYFYRFESGSFSQTKRCILVK